MDRARITELHSLHSVDNLASIVAAGILCFDRAREVPHRSIANEAVQARRDARQIPGDGMLHAHACLFFHARTPMLSYWLYQGAPPDSFVVIRVDPAVLDMDDVKIADGNAAKSRTRFHPSPAGLAVLDEAEVYATWWTDPDPVIKDELARKRSAEVLVPDRVPPEYILGFLVNSDGARTRVEGIAPGYTTEVDPYLFFGSTTPPVR